MSNLTPTSPHKDFEGIKKVDSAGIEYWEARELMPLLDYQRWENFEALVNKAIQIINTGTQRGIITNSSRTVELGSGSRRIISDYKLDKDAVLLLEKMSAGYKLFRFTVPRNETLILSQLVKYLNQNHLKFVFQYQLNNHKYDLMIENKILIEFDEQHHTKKRQHPIDTLKNEDATKNGFALLRFDPTHDIIDIITKIQSFLSSKKPQADSSKFAAYIFTLTQAYEKAQREGVTDRIKARDIYKDAARVVKKTIEEIENQQKLLR